MEDKIPETTTEKEFLSEKVYKDTIRLFTSIVKELPLYPEILDSLNNGEASVELRKRVLLRSIDEVWVTAIEDSLHSLDTIIRKPSREIEDQEVVLPIELTRRVTSRAIKHLALHTDHISEVTDDDEVVPSKLLNVFREETMLTYENKFVNTLINRLNAFVSRRYDIALMGQDVKNTALEFKDDFHHGDAHAKIHFRIEVEEPAKPEDAERNYVLYSDVWKRVKRLKGICDDYMRSTFVAQMGNNYIIPPVLHSNAILKNKDLRQCLALWEFIESYENTGFSTTVNDSLLQLSESTIRELYSSMAAQYLVFRTHIDKGFDGNEELANLTTDLPLNPEIIEDLAPASVTEFALHISQIEHNIGEISVEEAQILRAIEVALLADNVIDRRAQLEDMGDKYDRSYEARLILAQEPAQTFYTLIKNYLLSYKNVKSKISWKHESFTAGRKMVARLAVKGKTLVIYLPLDPNKEEYRCYRIIDMSEFAKYQNVPLGMKIQSKRAANIAIRLITDVMNNYNIAKDESAVNKDYHLAPQTKEQLIARGLIKVNNRRLGNGSFDEPIVLYDAEGNLRTAVLNRSFQARLILAQDPAQKFYTELKNFLLSFKNVKSRISWKYDSFNLGRDKCARLNIKGKTLVLYLPLNPLAIDAEHYHTFDVSESPQYENTPLAMKIRSGRAVKYAKELITKVMRRLQAVELADPVVLDYHLPPQDNNSLINEGLIKLKLSSAKMFAKNKRKEDDELVINAGLASAETEKVAAVETVEEEVAEQLAKVQEVAATEQVETEQTVINEDSSSEVEVVNISEISIEEDKIELSLQSDAEKKEETAEVVQDVENDSTTKQNSDMDEKSNSNVETAQEEQAKPSIEEEVFAILEKPKKKGFFSQLFGKNKK